MRNDSSISSATSGSTGTQTHLFVIDALDTLNLELDSSLRLAREIEKAGHSIYITTISNLGWESGQKSAHAKVAKLEFKGSATNFVSSPNTKRFLADFSAIHMRKDPPFDLDYVSATWLLESAAPNTRIYNDPRALRSLNEKLAIFGFPHAAEAALVSSDPEELLEFISEKCSGDAVLKPLLLFGGRGVERIELKKLSKSEILEMLRLETVNSTVARLVQPFNKAIFAGEVRAFSVGGLPLAWCLKKPAPGNFLANTRAGATLVEYEPTKEEVAMVTDVSTRLLAEGVYLIGFDLIGGALSEINLTSPRLLQAPTDKRNYYETMAKWFIQDCKAKSQV